MPGMDTDTVYRMLGEFVVSFQWLETRFREMGWVILDPHRKEWPPRALRNESFASLVDKVEELYLGLMDRLDIDDADRRKGVMSDIVRRSHQIREHRNRIIHSAYIELKAGGEVLGFLRSNPKLKEHPTSDELLWDQEPVTEETFESAMKELAQVAVDVNTCYVQLIQWAPFDKIRDT